MVRTGDGTQPGDPAKAAPAILAALAADQTPLRLPLGSDAVDAISAHLNSLHPSAASLIPATLAGTDAGRPVPEGTFLQDARPLRL
jgi:hypothetical protein